MKRIILILSVLVVINPLYADRKLAVTVYNQDFAVVKDIRTIAIDPKTKRTSLADISASIDPTSVQIRAIDNPKFSVIEQNFEYDLLSTNKLLDRMIDKPISIMLDDGRYFEGTLLAVDGNRICIKDVQGGIKIISRNKHFYQIALRDLPKGLRLKPALVWKISDGQKKKEKVEIAYQTSKLSWRADYNVTVNPVNQTLAMNGWVTITNRSGTSFPDAHLKLVAGEVHKVKELTRAMEDKMVLYAAKRAAPAPPPGFKERSFAEYHLYDLGRKTSIANNETKQIELFDIAGVKYKTEYIYQDESSYDFYRWRGRRFDIDGEQQVRPLRVSIVFKNTKKNQLGIPLPAGVVRLYQRDSQNVEHLTGQDKIDHTPKDETVRLTAGRAFDVLGSKKIVSTKRISNYESTVDVLIKIRNHKSIAIPVVVKEKLAGWQNWTIENNNLDYKKIDYRTIEFRFGLKANSEQNIRYRVHYKRYSW